MHVRWDAGAAATPHGQWVFFAEFLATTGVFERGVSGCPLEYRSGNAPDKREVLGTLMLRLLAGHRRYAHITALRGDAVAAQALGLTDWQIIRRHIIPNTIGPVIVFVTVIVPKVILLESFLSFLGLGVQAPLASWGTLISEGAASMQNAPWLLIFPSITMVVTLMAFNFIGDGLRDAIDPKDR